MEIIMIYGHLRALEWDIVSTGSLWEMGLKLVALLRMVDIICM